MHTHTHTNPTVTHTAPTTHTHMQYPWTGETVEHPRRDKRHGRHTAFVKRTSEGHPCIV